MKNSIKKDVVDLTAHFFGYNKEEICKFVVVESKAINVRIIIVLYQNGFSVCKVKMQFEEDIIKTVTKKVLWSIFVIDQIMSNENYAGDMFMQRDLSKIFKIESARN